jgi:chromosome segregation ATPase
MATLSSWWQRLRDAVSGNRTHVDDPSASDGESAPSRWSLSRRPSRADQQQRYQQVLELMDAMRGHFDRQSEHARQLTESVQHVGSVLEQLAAAQRDQGEHIRSMAGRVEAASAHAAKLSETLHQMPGSLHAQTEALRAMSRQLDIGQEADHRVADSLQQLGRAVETLHTSATTQVETLRQLNAREQEQQVALSAVVREQGRRFLIISVIAGVVVLAALAALVIALVVTSGRAA